MAKIDSDRYALPLSPHELREHIFNELAPIIAGMDLQRNRCLVATYFPPKMTAGGIIRPAANVEENRWQGKAGLLLKCGPTAFDYDEILDMSEAMAPEDFNLPQVGDWIAYTTSDTREMAVKVEPNVGVSCRIIYDDAIVMRLSDPSTIW